MMTSTRWTLFVPAVALLMVALLWWTNHTPTTSISSVAPAPACQLHSQNCHSHYQDIDISLDISPKPIPIAKPLSIVAKVTGTTPTQVQLDINGSNMYMGYNRINLTPQIDGSWTGKSLLAFCTTDAMQWQLTLLITLTDGSQLQVPFLLTTPFSNLSQQ